MNATGVDPGGSIYNARMYVSVGLTGALASCSSALRMFAVLMLAECPTLASILRAFVRHAVAIVAACMRLCSQMATSS